jgi:hypothetical protein
MRLLAEVILTHPSLSLGATRRVTGLAPRSGRDPHAGGQTSSGAREGEGVRKLCERF